jgi:transposase
LRDVCPVKLQHVPVWLNHGDSQEHTDNHIYPLMRILGVDRVPRPCLVDLRARAIGEAGASRWEMAEHFDTGSSAVTRSVRRLRETGSMMAKPCGGTTSPLEEYEDWLSPLVSEQPDWTLDKIVGAMCKQGIPGRRTAVWRFFQRHDITLKKRSQRATEQEREDVPEARHRWMLQQVLFDAARLVFIDETATSANMARAGGRSVRGERLVRKMPLGHCEALTFAAGLRCDGVVAPFMIRGAMGGLSFLPYIERVLVRTLKCTQLVIMHSLPMHKVAGVREAIEAAGVKLLLLPKYSPDLNLIELFFSKLKALLRAAQRTKVRSLLATSASAEWTNYFKHAG